MFNVCYGCGSYNAAKSIRPSSKGRFWALAVCPVCGYQHSFRKLPLFIVCGASGTGKTALCSTFSNDVTPFIPLEGDILWCPVFNSPNENYRDFYEIWLRMAKNIGQSGYPVILFSAGAGVPENIQNCTERRYFADIHTLALVCDSTTLEQRLQKRPEWRNCNQDFIQRQQEFNHWYIEAGSSLYPPITLLDTSKLSLHESAAVLTKWIHQHLPDSHGY